MQKFIWVNFVVVVVVVVFKFNKGITLLGKMIKKKIFDLENKT